MLEIHYATDGGWRSIANHIKVLKNCFAINERMDKCENLSYNRPKPLILNDGLLNDDLFNCKNI